MQSDLIHGIIPIPLDYRVRRQPSNVISCKIVSQWEAEKMSNVVQSKVPKPKSLNHSFCPRTSVIARRDISFHAVALSICVPCTNNAILIRRLTKRKHRRSIVFRQIFKWLEFVEHLRNSEKCAILRSSSNFVEKFLRALPKSIDSNDHRSEAFSAYEL